MYKFVPAGAAQGLTKFWPALKGNVAFTLVDGAIRIALFLLFVWGISLWADIKRVYRYHGAEHKTVFAFEDHGMPSRLPTRRSIPPTIHGAAPAS